GPDRARKYKNGKPDAARRSGYENAPFEVAEQPASDEEKSRSRGKGGRNGSTNGWEGSQVWFGDGTTEPAAARHPNLDPGGIAPCTPQMNGLSGPNRARRPRRGGVDTRPGGSGSNRRMSVCPSGAHSLPQQSPPQPPAVVRRAERAARTTRDPK